MLRPFTLLGCSVILAMCLSAAPDDPVTFKTDVALTRVDAKVTDGQGRVITGLGVQDFRLSLNSKPVVLKSVGTEDVPLDIVLLLDVSGSMEAHVQRIAQASRQALNVLGEQDRMAVMTFDTRTVVKLPLKGSHREITAALDRIMQSEHFAGGTRITSAMLDAARYLERQARPEARRAVVILTDDQTQDEEDERTVEFALNRAGAVLSFLQAPYDPQAGYGGGGPMGGGRGRRGGTWGSGGGWPGSSGPWGGGGGGGMGWPGRGGGGPGMGGPLGGDRSHTAGTDTIAADTGGDTFRVSDASALEDTLSRLRQRYALYCYLGEGQTLKENQAIRVELSPEVQSLHVGAEIQARRVFMDADGVGEHTGPVAVSHAKEQPDSPAASENGTTEDTSGQSTRSKTRSRAVNEDSGPHVNTVSPPEP